jgi:hypothetical protein
LILVRTPSSSNACSPTEPCATVRLLLGHQPARAPLDTVLALGRRIPRQADFALKGASILGTFVNGLKNRISDQRSDKLANGGEASSNSDDT